MERRGRMNYGMKKNYEESSFLRVDRLAISVRSIDSYCMACRLKMDKLYGAHVFELIRCYRSEM